MRPLEGHVQLRRRGFGSEGTAPASGQGRAAEGGGEGCAEEGAFYGREGGGDGYVEAVAVTSMLTFCLPRWAGGLVEKRKEIEKGAY